MSAADSYSTTNGRPSVAATSTSTSNVTIENASELSFPAEFDTDVQILSNAQVAVILQMSAQNAMAYDMELNDVYKKTQKYVERYNTMKNPEKDHQELVDELDNLQKLSHQIYFSWMLRFFLDRFVKQFLLASSPPPPHLFFSQFNKSFLPLSSWSRLLHNLARNKLWCSSQPFTPPKI